MRSTLAEELTKHPERWMQGMSGQLASGAPTPPNDPDAVCWCLNGLLYREAWLDIGHHAQALDLLAERQKRVVDLIGPGDHTYLSLARDIVKWNDQPGRTVTEVIEVLKKAGL